MAVSELPKVMHCWPKHWLQAAVKAGLAHQPVRDGAYYFRSIEGQYMRQKLEEFAESILNTQAGGE